ncbi:hypothetical protein [Clostridium lacusfryxellense]|uniref:hypothetical protein n=1 Tax=Clostridium lacusfryxellense TaxID=205328 RepID=UPI001C0E785A|nr:hypothetical protein [Clostridium lacusfryxellense]MBU3112179.1 hypothetical protein [Clostridium lacusfryxellense]
MYYIIMSLLFLKPSIKKEHVNEQIARAITGLIFGWFLFYLANVDRSIYFIMAALWVPAIFQMVFSLGSKDIHKGKFIWGMCILLFLSIGYNLYPYITAGSSNLASSVPVKESTEGVSKADANHIIIISPETAYYEMQKMIGTLPNPSIYSIGQLGVTQTKNGACYVAPIEVDGIFRALTNSEIPGAIYVSAEKPEEAKVISVTSKIAESLLLKKDLQRYMRSQKPSSILFEANVELDDSNNPYYVGSYGHYKLGRKFPVIEGVLIYSFKDAKVVDYDVAKAPEWVDEVYPSDVAELYNKYFGAYGKGLLNKIIAKKGVHVPTTWEGQTQVEGLNVNSKEVTGVIDTDGRMKWFTDHTNTSETSTTMTGYSMTDMRSGEMIYYKTPGYINGKGAMNAVDKALGADKANWTPVQPLFYNIFGSEAWVVPVVNKNDGAIVKIAIVAAKNSYAVVEESKEAAIESFKNAISYGKISDSTDKNANSIKAEEKSITGKVLRINHVTESGNTVFYVKLVGNNTIFMVTKAAGIDIVLTNENDEVEIKYLDIKDNNIVSTIGFKNNNLK